LTPVSKSGVYSSFSAKERNAACRGEIGEYQTSSELFCSLELGNTEGNPLLKTLLYQLNLGKGSTLRARLLYTGDNAYESPYMKLEPFKELSRCLLHSVRHFFGTTRSVFERVGLPAAQGKCMTDLYVTCSTEACTAGCTTDL
jgi:hypothetical protein